MVALASLLLVPSSLIQSPFTPVPPQEGEHETVVSARKLEEPLAGVPESATVVERAELEQAGLATVRDAAARVPNLFFSEFTSRRLSFPFLRGVGSGINDPAVITYVDDVPQFGFGGTNLPLLDVERVEFLRGPQGTLYGRNALGGLIHVRGARPTNERVYGAGASFGSYDLAEFSAGYSGPVGAGLLADVGLMTSRRDGFSKNDVTGNSVDDRDGSFGRGRVLWNPSLNSELDFSVFGEHARDGGFALSFLDPVVPFGVTGLEDRPHRIQQDFEGVAERDVLNPALAWRVFGDDSDFVSVTSYETWDVLETSDFDFTPVDGVRRRSEEDQSYVYQEFRLASAQSRSRHEARWVLGASGFLSDSEREATNTFRPGGAGIFFPPASVGDDRTAGEFDDQGVALFGQGSLPVNETLDLTAGLRLDHEHKEVERLHTFDPGGGPIVVDQGKLDEDFDELLPMVGASAHLTEEALLYVHVARGFKSGGFNLTAPTAGQLTFDPESNWTYELGYRQSFDEERYHLAAAAFYIDWEDMQLSLFDPVAGGYVANAGESKSQGLELEGQAALGAGWDASASLGLLDSHIDEFVDPFGNDTSGNELPQAPDSTWSLGLQYAGELGQQGRWFVRGDYQDVGDFFYDAGNLRGDSFSLVNFRAGLAGRHLGLTVWVRNAFDEEYIPIAFQPSPVDPNTFVGESGAPRVLGFTLSVHL